MGGIASKLMGSSSSKIAPLGNSHGNWARLHQGLVDREKIQNYAEALQERSALRVEQRKERQKKQMLKFLEEEGWDFSNMP